MWPENWAAYQLFYRMRTQWNASFGGLVGLRYEALYPHLDRLTKTPEEWDQLLDDVQTLEMAALRQMSDDRKKT